MAGAKQHYVPRSYLQYFTEDGKLYVFDLDKYELLNNSEPISLKNIAFGKGYYRADPKLLSESLIEPTDNPDFVDDVIRKYNEHVSAPLFDSFSEFRNIKSIEVDVDIIASIRTADIMDFVLVQLFRGPYFRSNIKKSISKYKLKTDINVAVKHLQFSFILYAICTTSIWKNDNRTHLLKQSQRNVLSEVELLRKDLLTMKRTLIVSGIDKYFITSDNPVAFERGENGELETVIFSLTKETAFMFHRFDSIDKGVAILTKKNLNLIDFVNSFYLNTSFRFLYTHTKDCIKLQ